MANKSNIDITKRSFRQFLRRTFEIGDRMNYLLSTLRAKSDLAKTLKKNESEISKWLNGNHNFTIKTLTKIEVAIGESLIMIVGSEEHKELLSSIENLKYENSRLQEKISEMQAKLAIYARKKSGRRYGVKSYFKQSYALNDKLVNPRLLPIYEKSKYEVASVEVHNQNGEIVRVNDGSILAAHGQVGYRKSYSKRVKL